MTFYSQIFKEQHLVKVFQASKALNKPDDLFKVSTQILATQSMVEPGGIEPPTSCVQGRRSPS